MDTSKQNFLDQGISGPRILATLYTVVTGEGNAITYTSFPDLAEDNDTSTVYTYFIMYVDTL